MTDTSPSLGNGFVLPADGRVSNGQAFVALPPRLALPVLDPSQALGIDRGDWIIAEPCNRWTADARYVLRSGEVVRLRALWRGEDVELTRGNGAVETITLTELAGMVAARVVRVLRP